MIFITWFDLLTTIDRVWPRKNRRVPEREEEREKEGRERGRGKERRGRYRENERWKEGRNHIWLGAQPITQFWLRCAPGNHVVWSGNSQHFRRNRRKHGDELLTSAHLGKYNGNLTDMKTTSKKELLEVQHLCRLSGSISVLGIGLMVTHPSRNASKLYRIHFKRKWLSGLPQREKIKSEGKGNIWAERNPPVIKKRSHKCI